LTVTNKKENVPMRS